MWRQTGSPFRLRSSSEHYVRVHAVLVSVRVVSHALARSAGFGQQYVDGVGRRVKATCHIVAVYISADVRIFLAVLRHGQRSLFVKGRVLLVLRVNFNNSAEMEQRWRKFQAERDLVDWGGCARRRHVCREWSSLYRGHTRGQGEAVPFRHQLNVTQTDVTSGLLPHFPLWSVSPHNLSLWKECSCRGRRGRPASMIRSFR